MEKEVYRWLVVHTNLLREYNKIREKLTLWFIWRLPRWIVKWCYIRVISTRGDYQPWYQKTLDIWEQKESK